MDPAGIRSRDHVQPRRDGVVGRLVVAGHLEREHRAVHQGRLPEGAALRVEPLAPGIQHGGAAAQGALRAGHGGGQAG